MRKYISRPVVPWGAGGAMVPPYFGILVNPINPLLCPHITTGTPGFSDRHMALYLQLWQYGLWSFQTGGTKLERFFPKNQHTQRKFLNFENWTNGEPQYSVACKNQSL